MYNELNLPLNKKYSYLELEMGLLPIEFLILNELYHYKNGIDSGLFFGLMISKHELLDIRKLKIHLKNLCSGELNLISVNNNKISYADISDLKFTTEVLKLSELGFLLMDLKLNYNYNLPLSLLRSRTYDIVKSDNITYKNIALDRLFLHDYLTNTNLNLLDSLCFSKELGYDYLNEKSNLIELLKFGKCQIDYLNSHFVNVSHNEFLLYDNISIPISYKDISDLNKDYKSSCLMNYLFLSNDGTVILKSLEKLLSDFLFIFNNISKINQLKLLNILKSNYNCIPYSSEIDYELYRIVYNFNDKKILLFNFNDFSNYSINHFDTIYNFDLLNFDYFAIYSASIKRIDLLNLNEILCDTNILGLVSLPVNSYSCRVDNFSNVVYLINELGEIKVVKNSEFNLRNKKIKLKNIEYSRIVKVIEIPNLDIVDFSNLNKGILLISKNGYIKVLNLLEYKIKNKFSQSVMGINLDSHDSLVYVSSLDISNPKLCLSLDLGCKLNVFEIYNLFSSKINKGKKLKMKSDFLKSDDIIINYLRSEN